MKASESPESAKEHEAAGAAAGTREFPVKKAKLKRPAAHFVRRHKTRLAIIFAILLIGGIGAVIILSESGEVKEGTPAPDFTIKNVQDGSTFRLSEHRGKPVLVDFMGIDCPSCTKMMPVLKQLYDQYKGKVEIVSVDIYSGDTESTLRQHMEKYGAAWPAGIDTTESIKKEYMEGGYFTDPVDKKQVGIPAFVLLDGNGYVVWREVGLTDIKYFQESISAVLSGQYTTLTVAGQNLLIFSYTLGLLMFFAPCALPLLPGYMGYYMAKHGDKGTVITSTKNGLIAALGIFVTYLAVGALASLIGAAAGAIILSLVPFIGALLVLLGALMFFHVQIPTQWFSEGIGRLKGAILRKRGGAVTEAAPAVPHEKGLFSYGIVYGTASMGCSMPVFIGIIAVALMYGPLYAFMALAMFGAGMATLMVVVTVIVGLAKRTIVQRFVGAIGIMNRISALLLVGVGLYLLLESLGAF